ncbi:uncharacterized protein LOC118645621 [Monomorium pharaonis]|uniref:uncharacterized protein LOC118645621 n=1 Tax=Monomorium pharaonis TaxID=307658 RepID=UPI0017462D75|nr:uncharacterized protein LOC118645621 [Monomorium pharaonis]
MDNKEELLIYTLFVLIMGIYIYGHMYIIKKRQSFRWTNRNYWVRPINIRRPNQGDFYQLFQELKDDPDMFFRYTRMSLSIFDELLEIIKPFLIKRNYRALVPERLAITLRYLATGDQVLSIALAYRIGESTARNIIKEICDIIINLLAPLYPTEQEWI